MLQFNNVLKIHLMGPSQIQHTNNSISHLNPKTFRLSTSTNVCIHPLNTIILHRLGEFSNDEQEFLRNEFVLLFRSSGIVPPAVLLSVFMNSISPTTN